ncbi:unnamed protein product [Vitrella brassicaformis CCMP3155]|uniref:Uncharacterized protein n=3 Tax=Vitrella brassicaformis TaxID=1169539 RepID=A0A0G4EL45_VITBC|nr:unnamed protein product [Vitrella brassicaformis CCMP3155]|eukprot:CEL97906.1 unnamed protein product [Vitrella brassicaformis CCMP3155]
MESRVGNAESRGGHAGGSSASADVAMQQHDSPARRRGVAGGHDPVVVVEGGVHMGRLGTPVPSSQLHNHHDVDAPMSLSAPPLPSRIPVLPPPEDPVEVDVVPGNDANCTTSPAHPEPLSHPPHSQQPHPAMAFPPPPPHPYFFPPCFMPPQGMYLPPHHLMMQPPPVPMAAPASSRAAGAHPMPTSAEEVMRAHEGHMSIGREVGPPRASGGVGPRPPTIVSPRSRGKRTPPASATDGTQIADDKNDQHGSFSAAAAASSGGPAPSLPLPHPSHLYPIPTSGDAADPMANPALPHLLPPQQPATSTCQDTTTNTTAAMAMALLHHRWAQQNNAFLRDKFAHPEEILRFSADQNAFVLTLDGLPAADGQLSFTAAPEGDGAVTEGGLTAALNKALMLAEEHVRQAEDDRGVSWPSKMPHNGQDNNVNSDEDLPLRLPVAHEPTRERGRGRGRGRGGGRGRSRARGDAEEEWTPSGGFSAKRPIKAKRPPPTPPPARHEDESSIDDPHDDEAPSTPSAAPPPPKAPRKPAKSAVPSRPPKRIAPSSPPSPSRNPYPLLFNLHPHKISSDATYVLEGNKLQPRFEAHLRNMLIKDNQGFFERDPAMRRRFAAQHERKEGLWRAMEVVARLKRADPVEKGLIFQKLESHGKQKTPTLVQNRFLRHAHEGVLTKKEQQDFATKLLLKLADKAPTWANAYTKALGHRYISWSRKESGYVVKVSHNGMSRQDVLKPFNRNAHALLDALKKACQSRDALACEVGIVPGIPVDESPDESSSDDDKPIAMPHIKKENNDTKKPPTQSSAAKRVRRAVTEEQSDSMLLRRDKRRWSEPAGAGGSSPPSSLSLIQQVDNEIKRLRVTFSGSLYMTLMRREVRDGERASIRVAVPKRVDEASGGKKGERDTQTVHVVPGKTAQQIIQEAMNVRHALLAKNGVAPRAPVDDGRRLRLGSSRQPKRRLKKEGAAADDEAQMEPSKRALAMPDEAEDQDEGEGGELEGDEGGPVPLAPPRKPKMRRVSRESSSITQQSEDQPMLPPHPDQDQDEDLSPTAAAAAHTEQPLLPLPLIPAVKRKPGRPRKHPSPSDGGEGAGVVFEKSPSRGRGRSSRGRGRGRGRGGVSAGRGRKRGRGTSLPTVLEGDEQQPEGAIAMDMQRSPAAGEGMEGENEGMEGVEGSPAAAVLETASPSQAGRAPQPPIAWHLTPHEPLAYEHLLSCTRSAMKDMLKREQGRDLGMKICKLSLSRKVVIAVKAVGDSDERRFEVMGDTYIHVQEAITAATSYRDEIRALAGMGLRGTEGGSEPLAEPPPFAEAMAAGVAVGMQAEQPDHSPAAGPAAAGDDMRDGDQPGAASVGGAVPAPISAPGASVPFGEVSTDQCSGPSEANGVKEDTHTQHKDTAAASGGGEELPSQAAAAAAAAAATVAADGGSGSGGGAGSAADDVVMEGPP